MKQSMQCPGTARAQRRSFASCLRWFAALLLAIGAVSPAWANCPAVVNLNVAPGGSIALDCAIDDVTGQNLGFYEIGPAYPGDPIHSYVTPHGHADADNLQNYYAVTYYNTSGAGTTDTFTLHDGTDQTQTRTVTFNIHISGSAPSAPGAPIIGTATAGNATASVSFSAPVSDGGSAITSYTVISSPGNFSGNDTASPITVPGLTNGTAYTFTVRATNAIGSSAASAASNSVIPKGSQTITFNNPGAQNVDTSPTLTATASSGLTTTFTTTTAGVCTITNSGALTFLSTGTCTIHADQGGNNAYLPAPTATQSFDVIASPPVVTSVSPNTGSTAGGASVTITGSHFTGATTVTFGAVNASFNFNTATSITAIAPPGSPGSVNVTVTTSGGTSAGGASSQFTYVSPPMAGAVSATVAYGSTANPITLNISGGTATSVAVASAAAHGTASASGTNITYTPTAGFVGSDSFNYTATNGSGTSAPATVTITVNPPATPVVSAKSVTTAYSTAAAIDLSGSITGVNITSVNIGTGPAHGTVSVSGETVTYTPSSTYYGGSDSFTYTATNAGGTSAPATVTITVGAPAAPTAAPKSVTTAYNTAAAIDLSGSITGVDITAVNIGTAPTHGTVSVSGETVTYTPSSTYYGGSDSFTYTATNGGGTSAPATVTITVGAPAAPTAAAKSVNTAFNTAASIDLASSITGVNITDVNIGSGSSHGTVSIIGTTVTYTPAVNYYGSDSFTYTATNPGGTSAPATVTITVDVPGVPTAAAKSVSTAFNTVANIDLTGSITGVGITAVNIGDAPAHGTVSVSGKTVTYTPSSTYYGGNDSFTYTATNAGGTSAPATVTVTVGAPAAPTAAAKSVSTAFNTAANIDLTSSITGVGITAVNVGNAPSHGTVTVSGKTVTYTPSSTYYGGNDSFTYTATNGGGTSAPATVTITVGTPSAPTAAPKSVTTAYNTAAAIDLSGSITGAGISAVAVAAAPTHGTVSVSGETVTYTPSPTYYGGSDNFTYTATNAGGISAPATVTITVGLPAAPTVTTQSVTTAYDTVAAIDLSGSITGVGISAVTVATAPTHGTVSVSGETASYTPSSTYYGGSDSFTYTATNAGGTSAPATVTITVGAPAVPTVAAKSVTTAYNTAAAIDLSGSITGVGISAVTVATAPTHGTASVTGETITYTPSSAYFSGSDTLTYTATNPGGISAPATVTITITPLAVPTAVAQTATVLAGKAVTIHATQGATGGPFTAVTLTSSPTLGAAVISGEDIVYTPTTDQSGKVSFNYTLSNNFGVSQPATVTIDVHPVPLVAAQTVEALAGTTVQVDLTRQARGGPFTGANLISVSPTSAGTGTIVKNGDGYRLDFATAATFSGAAQVSFTLSNAYATSAAGIITVNVTARPDPSKDAEVLGILGAQANAARRFAIGQIDNFQRRLEGLHGSGSQSAFSNGLSFNSGGGMRHRGELAGNNRTAAVDERQRRYLVDPNDAPIGADTDSAAGPRPGALAFWAGGAVNFGTQKLGGSHNGVDFTTSGVSVGVDKRLSPELALGVGAGYGHDASDIGRNGSRSTANGYNVATYASYQPSESTYVDGLVGYQWLSFDARRYLTANGGQVSGSRDGKQWFGSLSAGYEHHGEHLLLSPYGRLDMASARLDAYTEHGDALYSLRYDEQTVKTTTGSVGLRMNYPFKRDFGLLAPQVRVEYQHDFQGSSTANIRYADLLTGPLYRAQIGSQSRNHTLLGVGLQLQTWRGLMFRVEYQNLFDNSTRNNQSILLGLEVPFNP